MPSTVISNFTYDPASKTLRITFVSGTVYVYEDVPEQVFFNMKESGARGIFFNREIKDKYAFRRL